MSTLKFVCEEHREHGENGWRLENEPDFDPLGGMGTAHDCLEHFKNGWATTADEFQAFGAMYCVRGYEYFSGQYNSSPGHNQSTETADIIERIVRGDLELSKPPRTARIADEDEIDRCISEARKEFSYRYEGYDGAREDRRRAEALLPYVRGWMRIGYRRAQRRYKHCPNPCRMFREIEREADNALKNAELGDTLTVKFNIKSGDTNVTLRHQWEDYTE